MKETFESIKKALNDRISSPVMGTFCLFWLTLNWSVLVLLWKSSAPIEDTIETIYVHKLTLLKSIIYPLLLTVSFLIIYPWAALAAAMYSDWVNFRRIKQKHAQEVLILGNQKALVTAQAELDNLREEKKHEQTMKQADLDALRQERMAQLEANKSITARAVAESQAENERFFHEQRRIKKMKSDLELEAQRVQEEKTFVKDLVWVRAINSKHLYCHRMAKTLQFRFNRTLPEI